MVLELHIGMRVAREDSLHTSQRYRTSKCVLWMRHVAEGPAAAITQLLDVHRRQMLDTAATHD